MRSMVHVLAALAAISAGPVVAGGEGEALTLDGYRARVVVSCGGEDPLAFGLAQRADGRFLLDPDAPAPSGKGARGEVPKEAWTRISIVPRPKAPDLLLDIEVEVRREGAAASGAGGSCFLVGGGVAVRKGTGWRFEQSTPPSKMRLAVDIAYRP